ncbi:hypothetical protein BGZ96_006623 [Linnemannia gamsii]|uniref:Uncharacterized protein n=1 Tax=Linnemannia gamsii TaxID=64522 RepID=A0ABQ7K371_9FUNG|nr:hypothetical protein BGZ96_006623 [Linnemannia gamsii]
MGQLKLFCLAATEDSSSLYGVAYGYNASDPTVGQLVILVKADVSAPTSISLSSLTWSLVGLIQRYKVTSIPDNSPYYPPCAVSSGGIFTFLSPNVVPLNITSNTGTTTGGFPGGFRYDPTQATNVPSPLPPPSTANCNNPGWDNLWRTITVDANVGWNSTATKANTYASLFYVPKTSNSTGFGATENLVLSHLNDGTVYFAQEDNTFNLYHTGTLRTPTTYMSSITAYTNYAGYFYLIGPSATTLTNVTTVLGIPMADGYLGALPSSTYLKVYNSAPGSIPANFTGGCAGLGNIVLASVTLNSLFYFCLNLVGQNHTLFSIPNVLSDSQISAPTLIPASTGSSVMYGAVKNLVSFSSPASATDRHPYGVLFGGSGIFGLGLDPYDTSDMNAAQTISVSDPEGVHLTNSESGGGSVDSGNGGSSGVDNGKKVWSTLDTIACAVGAVLVLALVAVIVFFRKRSKARRKNTSTIIEEHGGDDAFDSSPLSSKPRHPQQRQPSYHPQQPHYQGQKGNFIVISHRIISLLHLSSIAMRGGACERFFDIPELVNLLSSSLDYVTEGDESTPGKKDLANLARTCRKMHRLCTPSLYKVVVNVLGREFPFFRSTSARDGFLRNFHRVRGLNFQEDELVYYYNCVLTFENTGTDITYRTRLSDRDAETTGGGYACVVKVFALPPISRLTQLSLSLGERSGVCYFMPYAVGSRELLAKLCWLVSLNPCLAFLRLYCVSVRNLRDAQLLAEVIGGLSKLETLDLCISCKGDFGDDLSPYRESEEDVDEEKRRNEVMKSVDKKLRPLINLKELTVHNVHAATWKSEVDARTMFAYCPNIRTLKIYAINERPFVDTIGEVIGQECPKIETLSYCSATGVEDDSLPFRIMGSLSAQHVTRFDFMISIPVMNNAFQQHSATLQSIQISYVNGHHKFPASAILKACNNL